MRILQYKHDPGKYPIVGDIVYYYDFENNKDKIGIVVELSIEECEEEIIDDSGESIEYVLQEYVCYVIANSTGKIYTTSDDIHSYHRPKN